MKIELKSPREIELMRAAGKLVASILDEIATLIKVGVTTKELDDLAQRRIREAGADPLFMGVEIPQARFPFPAAICASLNEEVVHGIPDGRPLSEGDLISIDCGVRLKGYCGDSARSWCIGTPSAETKKLMDVTKDTLDLAIRESKPGRKWSAIARKMEKLVEDAGFGIVKDFVGHGIGREMHEDPRIPNYDDGNVLSDFTLLPGMVLAIEPMVAAGSGRVVARDRDGWSMITKDHSLAAHYEHTIAITDDGVEILTPVG